MTEERSHSRQELLRYIDAVSFGATDSGLFLDTHPENTEAFEYFQQCEKERKEALLQYAREFAPLQLDLSNASCAERWKWIQEPWPWQEGGC